MNNHEAQTALDSYYHIDVAGLAQFLVNAADEEFAYLRLREYCKESHFLNIDPDAHFDIFNTIKPIDGEELLRAHKTQIGQAAVRLTGYLEISPRRPFVTTEPDLSSNRPTQLEFF